MGKDLDVIKLRGLSAVGHHGVYDFERSGSQVFTADLTLYVDARRAAETDDVQHTVDYSKMADAAVAILTGKPVYLLETLAHHLAQMALQNPLVQEVDVTVHKPMAPVAHLFNDVSVTLHRRRESTPPPPAPQLPPQLANLLVESPAPAPASHEVVLALGSNLGDSQQILARAVAALGEAPGLTVVAVSPLVLTRPVLAPGQQSQANYLNAVVLAQTTMAPEEVLALTQSIERQFGRRRVERWGPRTLDIDLIDYQGERIQTPTLTVPHPRAAQRAFVLYPWSLLRPNGRFAGHRLTDLAAQAPDIGGILNVVERWLPTDEPKPAPPVPSRAAAHRAAPPVTIRGNRVRLAEVEGDSIFQRLLHREEVRTRVDELRTTKRFSSTPPPPRRRRQPVETPPPVALPVETPLPPEFPPQRAADLPELPNWRFSQDSEGVRIVDSVTSEERPAPPPTRRRVIRPSPTGMIPLPDHGVRIFDDEEGTE